MVSFVLAALGFLLPFWPLSLVGIALAALSGHWLFAICVGLLIDIGFGAPLGRLHFLYFPFTLAAAVLSLGRVWSSKYMRKNPTDTL